MDIKAMVEELYGKIKGDDSLMKNFKLDPIKVLEKLLGKDLPDEKLKLIADGIKAKLSAEKLADVADSLGDALGGLFGKK